MHSTQFKVLWCNTINTFSHECTIIISLKITSYTAISFSKLVRNAVSQIGKRAMLYLLQGWGMCLRVLTSVGRHSQWLLVNTVAKERRISVYNNQSETSYIELQNSPFVSIITFSSKMYVHSLFKSVQ